MKHNFLLLLLLLFLVWFNFPHRWLVLHVEVCVLKRATYTIERSEKEDNLPSTLNPHSMSCMSEVGANAIKVSAINNYETPMHGMDS